MVPGSWLLALGECGSRRSQRDEASAVNHCEVARGGGHAISCPLTADRPLVSWCSPYQRRGQTGRCALHFQLCVAGIP